MPGRKVPCGTGKYLLLAGNTSPPGYYLRAAPGEGVTSWHIHFPGGGWCATKSRCARRAGQLLGGTTMWPPTNNRRFEGILSSNEGANPFFAGWHLAMPVYCDGGSYAGTAGRVVVGKRRYVHMDGSRIARAIMDDLLENRALSRATTVLVSGTSAGGLAVMRLCDSLAALLPRATVKCLLDGSFFPDAPDRTGRMHFQSLAQQISALHQFSPQSRCDRERLTDDDELVVRRPTTPFHPSLCLFLVPACSDPCV
ncbi:unnamed protein product [Closterium sp. NIES-65]|nr:unnamed protein product [Closterium sp. NIES-65]